MFSILWPPLSLVCLIHNGLKMRADGYKLYFHSRRPMPKRANGIGQWYTCLKFQAYVAVVVNVALVCISTGSIDFFYPTCVSKIKAKYQGNLDNYLMSPDFECLGITSRLATAVFLEHFVVLIIVYIMHSIKDTPDWLRIVIEAKEKRAKEIVLARSVRMPAASFSTPDRRGVISTASSNVTLPTPPPKTHRISIEKKCEWCAVSKSHSIHYFYFI